MSHQYDQQPRQGQQPTQTMDEHGMTGGQQMRSQQTGGQQMGSHTQAQGTRGQRSGTQPAPSFEDHLTDELYVLLEDFSELSHVTAWCAKECAAGPPALGICARICQDIAEIAELNEMLIARDSMFGPEVADMFVRVANEGLRELQQHQQQHPHIIETIATIERTMNSCETVLQRVGGQQTASQGMTNQMGGQQSGGRQTGGRGTTGGQRSMAGGQQSVTGGQRTGSQQMGGQQTGSRRSQRPPERMHEQGTHGQGMSGQPTGGAGSPTQQY